VYKPAFSLTREWLIILNILKSLAKGERGFFEKKPGKKLSAVSDPGLQSQLGNSCKFFAELSYKKATFPLQTFWGT